MGLEYVRFYPINTSFFSFAVHFAVQKPFYSPLFAPFLVLIPVNYIVFWSDVQQFNQPLKL